MNLEETWQQLEREGAAVMRHGILRRRISPQASCDIFVGVERPSGRRIFLIRVERAAAERAGTLPRMRGCELSRAQLPEDPANQVSVCLSLVEGRFSDVFTSLSEDLAQHLALVRGDDQVVGALIGRLERWRKFLQRTPEGLGEDAQRGLFGELWFLRQYLIATVGAGGAVQSWKGPTKAVHDFQLREASVEVKTTISKQHTKMLISSERQLDTSTLKHLILFHLSVETSASGGVTLPTLVDQVRSGLSNHIQVRELFEDMLLEAGYLDRHAVQYSQVFYHARTWHAFHVRDGFPRLIERSLPPGVGDLSYSIVIASCMPF
ncbi:MAG: PD-(D/E)XK motif protein, partial [Acidobacteria bacterium]|nr:PD-(D/E)XK motif protein [Acidobacteriota bacterium]